jgi:hypothetical protein
LHDKKKIERDEEEEEEEEWKISLWFSVPFPSFGQV